jgi:hypothetical protein
LGTVDAVGVLGATNEFQIYTADISQYIRAGSSTFALHAASARTGGVLPESFLVCGGARAYPKPFCGTDAHSLQAEFRLSDRIPSTIHFVVFTETAGSRIRGGAQTFASPEFQWHADSGIGVIYRSVRINFAYGSEGARTSFELQGQIY